MNIYFLVEGRRTEKKVYPKWLSHLIPELVEVSDPFKIDNNNFYIFNGNGFPSLLDNHLRNAVSDVNEISNFDYLVICLDSDDTTIDYRRTEVLSFIEKNKLKLDKSKFVIIVQNKCIETWFLGHRKVYSKQPQSKELRKYNKFYNVQENNPELMTAMDGFSTSAQFHEEYLSEMLLEKNIRYTKKNPNGVTEKHYLEELINRQSETNHLLSFKDFIDFCTLVKTAITTK
jgi:hypothetical protein